MLPIQDLGNEPKKLWCSTIARLYTRDKDTTVNKFAVKTCGTKLWFWNTFYQDWNKM